MRKNDHGFMGYSRGVPAVRRNVQGFGAKAVREEVITDPVTGLEFSIRMTPIDTKGPVMDMRYRIELIKLVDGWSSRCRTLRRKLNARWRR